MTAPVMLMALASLAAAAALAELVQLAGSTRHVHRRHRARRAALPTPPATHARWAARTSEDRRTERLLDAAGRIDVPDADALAAKRRLASLVGGAWGVSVGVMVLPVWLAIGAGFALAGIGGALPGLLLARTAARRTRALREDVPELLDLLAVALGCGMPIGPALAKLGQWGQGPLADGAGRAARELDHGAGLDQTLDRLVREHPVPELEVAVAVLQRSRRHGTPAAQPLRALAAEARQSRARRAMDHAAKAAPRVQLVAALLLVPAALCVLAASLVAGGIGA